MRRALSAASLGILLISSMVSCGGEFESGEGGGSGGTGGNGASSAGRGGSGPAGSSTGGKATAGSSAGGSGPVGGTNGAAGSGSGGSLPALCSLPAESGNCNAYFPSFFHNAQTGVCEPFAYGGCGGNENRFESLEACQAACSGGEPDLDACESPADCVLVQTACCAACDGGLESYTAINATYQEAFFAGRECEVACAPCEAPDPTLDYRRYFVATCTGAGQCIPVDLRAVGGADCETLDDCRLRDGARCCEGCSGGDLELIAVNDSGWVENLACGGEDVACPPCAPQYPAEYVATCEASMCELRRSLMP